MQFLKLHQYILTLALALSFTSEPLSPLHVVKGGRVSFTALYPSFQMMTLRQIFTDLYPPSTNIVTAFFLVRLKAKNLKNLIPYYSRSPTALNNLEHALIREPQQSLDLADSILTI